MLDGYFGDSAITYAVGEIDETSRKLMEVTEKARAIELKRHMPEIELATLGMLFKNMWKVLDSRL